MTTLTKIEWATHTFNPWIGCQHVTPGCENCYAEVNTFTRAQRAKGYELWGGPHTKRHIVSEAKWLEVMKWNGEARRSGQQTRVFCASMADWLEKRPDLVAPRARLIALIWATPDLTWLMLTKRPENARELLPAGWFQGRWPRNVWFGFSAEDQRRLDERWPHVALVPSPVLWCSYEPALGPVQFGRCLYPCEHHAFDGDEGPVAHLGRMPTRWRCTGCGVLRIDGDPMPPDSPGLAWIIYGGESGPGGARPNDIAWALSTRDQCKAARVAFFMKQAGANVRDRNDMLATDNPPVDPRDWPEPEEGWDDGPRGNIDRIDDGYQGAPVRIRLKDRKGGNPAEWPEDLRVREFPKAAA